MARATIPALTTLLLLAGPALPVPVEVRLPWREAGWSEREAAAHLLDRLAFGARPGDVDRMVAMGLDPWVERQLRADLPEVALGARLAPLPALALSPAQIASTYPPGFAVRRMAVEAGVVTQEEIAAAEAGDSAGTRRDLRRKIGAWMETQDLRPERELIAQSHAQKLLRAVYAENQLAEVLADFWFNHFSVSTTDAQVRSYLLTYERDALRPHLFGHFRDLLEATARHPAMLVYLDNFQSVANPGQPTTLAGELGQRRRGSSGSNAPAGPPPGGRARDAGDPARAGRPVPDRPPGAERPNRPQGLNENYARELLELHTLGVDGGYTQQDVVEVARALTGWSLLPPGRMGENGNRRFERVERAGGLGFVYEGDFLFRADAHDAGAKSVLGVALPAGRGIEDGEQVLDLLAKHPSTARHLAAKLAVRFVADEPPPDLVDRLAGVFTASGGDLRETLRALVESPEFWAKEARAAKVKSPFEVAATALRALGAEVDNPLPTLEWIADMGQPLYACAAPTGFPDRADFWVNTGALLARMNFGLELAAGRVPGLRFDLAALAGGHEPESAEAALAACGTRLLPERPLAPTLAALTPLLSDPEVRSRIEARAPARERAPWVLADSFADLDAMGPQAGGSERSRETRREQALAEGLDLFPRARPMATAGESPSPIAAAAGLLLGSPEFQRR